MTCVCDHAIEDHEGACTVDGCGCLGFEPIDDDD